MSSRTFHYVPGWIALALAALGLLSCSSRDSAINTPRQRVQAIEQLQEARQTDLERAKDMSLGPIAEEDYLAQAAKADSVIKELEENSDVPGPEISDALFVPPEHLSPEMRAQLIKQLEAAKALDDEKWHNNLGSEDEAWLTLLCDIQARRATRVINKLETAQPVSWREINEAMTTPEEIP
jgi:hypothetical protein